MTTLLELLQERPLTGHCFKPEYYIKADIHSGLLESRGGYRLAAFPEMLLKAIYSGLRYETGQAARVILYNCGQEWGQEFFRRFEQELTQYHQQPLVDLPIGVLIDAFQDLWATHGWGRLNLNFEHGDHGLVEAIVFNSGFAAAARVAHPDQLTQEPSCYLEAGVLSTVFSKLSGRDLTCVQTQCESMGSDRNCFLIGTSQRLRDCPEWIRKGISHSEILQRLL
ncbi:MAG: V4R domain-containing protein [Cyanobacteriota bacterium]|nr:V4R domain-containing protein [Cyanobacteriota bacterium]